MVRSEEGEKGRTFFSGNGWAYCENQGCKDGFYETENGRYLGSFEEVASNPKEAVIEAKPSRNSETISQEEKLKKSLEEFVAEVREKIGSSSAQANN